MKNAFTKQFPKNAVAAVGKCFSEAVAQRCSVKKLFLGISQNSQENICANVSLLLKFEAKVGNFISKETLAQVFPVNFAKFGRTPFLTEHLWWLLLVLQNRCFYKTPDIHQKISELKSLFNTVTGLKAHNFNKKRPQHKCFPVNITKFLRIPVLLNSPSDRFWIWSKNF